MRDVRLLLTVDNRGVVAGGRRRRLLAVNYLPPQQLIQTLPLAEGRHVPVFFTNIRLSGVVLCR